MIKIVIFNIFDEHCTALSITMVKEFSYQDYLFAIEKYLENQLFQLFNQIP